MAQLKKPMGRCFERVSNETGVKWIQALDILFIVNVPRSIVALWALCKPARWLVYIRVRELTFFAFWPIALLTLVSYTLTNYLLAEDFDQEKVAAIGLTMVAIMIGFCVDFHFRKVINYFGANNNLQGRIDA